MSESEEAAEPRMAQISRMTHMKRAKRRVESRSCFKTVATFVRTWGDTQNPTFRRTWLRRNEVLK